MWSVQQGQNETNPAARKILKSFWNIFSTRYSSDYEEEVPFQKEVDKIKKVTIFRSQKNTMFLSPNNPLL